MVSSLSLSVPQLKRFREYSDTFIETGTHEGGGVLNALEAGFEHVLSCEIDEKRYAVALYCIGKQDLKKATVVLGDSAVVFPSFIAHRDAPAIIFLDAHREGDNANFPLMTELAALANAPCKEHLVIVDDVDFCDKPQMNGLNIQHIKDALLLVNPNYKFSREWGARHEALLISDPR